MRYPWDQWFAAGRFLLRAGEDYHSRTDTFVQQIRQRASERGHKLRIWVAPDGQTIRVTVVNLKPKSN